VTGKDRRPVGETYLEIQQVGGSFRVAAIDAASGEEVIFQAPLKTPRHEIERVALAKLARKLDRVDPDTTAAESVTQEKRPDNKSGRDIKV
jgi:hypothetical protein